MPPFVRICLFESVSVKHVKAVHILENQHFSDLCRAFEYILVGEPVRISSADLLALKSAALVAALIERCPHFALRAVRDRSRTSDHGRDHIRAVPEHCDHHVPLFVLDPPAIGVIVKERFLELFPVHLFKTIGIR